MSTSAADASSSTNGADSKPVVTPQDIGWQFVPQYYTFVNKSPNRLHLFYTKNSTFIHGTEGDDAESCTGQEAINKKIMSLGFQDVKVFIHSVDSQPSMNGGILVQVIGEMSNNGGDWKKFAQTFFLAEQPNGYFVLNDIFRFLKDEPDAEAEAEEPVLDGEKEDEQLMSVDEVKEEEVKEETAPAPMDVDAAPTKAEPAQSNPTPSEPTPEPTPAPATAPEPEAPSSSPAPTPSAPEPSPVEPPVDNTSSVPTPPAPAPIELKKEEVKEEKKVEASPSPKSTPTPAAAEQSKPSPPPAPKETPSAPAAQKKPTPAAAPSPPPAPAAPAAPMSWAARAAASGKGAWGAGQLAQTQAASSAPAPKPVAPQTAGGPPAGPSRENSAIRRSAAAEAAMTVQTSQCFVKLASWQKGNSESDDQAVLQSALERFGPIKAIEIVTAKACAFLDFASLDSARRAIFASLPVNQGGEGGVRVGEGRVIVEVRKEKSERGPSGGGAPRAPRGSMGQQGQGQQQQQQGQGQQGQGGRGGPRGGGMGGRGGRGGQRGGPTGGAGPAKQ